MGPHPAFHSSTITSSNVLVLSPEAWGQIHIVKNLKIFLNGIHHEHAFVGTVVITEPGKPDFECVADTEATYEALDNLLTKSGKFTKTQLVGITFLGK